MKDKKVIYGLISASALIVIVSAAPVMSSLVWAQQPHIGTLRVVVINRAHCDDNPSVSYGGNCPASANMITRVIIDNTVHKTLPAAGCGHSPPACFGPDDSSPIRGGDHFTIEANQGTPAVCGHYPDSVPCSWEMETPHIVLGPDSADMKAFVPQCADVYAHTCGGTWPQYSGTITFDVNYHWKLK